MLRPIISACLVLPGCGPVIAPEQHELSGQSADVDGDGDAESGPSSVTVVDTTFDSSPSMDVGGGAVAPIAQCPAADAQGIAIDSQIRIELDATATPEILVGEAITLACAGQPIEGDLIAGPGQIVFVPSGMLPADSTCEVTLAEAAVTIDGVPVVSTTWSFSTSSTTGVEFDFDAPRRLVDEHGLNPERIDAEGDDVVLTWNLPMTIARSTDRGETFEITTLATVDGFGQMTDMHLQDGVVHLTWQILDSGNDGQCYYSRSEPGTGEMSDPLHLTALPHAMTSSWPSATTDGGDRVVVTWVETCFFEGPCGEDDSGLYMIESNDGGASFGPPVRVLGWDAWGYAELLGPRLGWIDGGLAGVWERYPDGVSTGVDLLDGEAGFATVSWIDGMPRWPRLARTLQNEAVVFAYDSVESQARLSLTRLRSRTGEGFDSPLLLAAQDGTDEFFASADAHGEDLVAVVTAEADFDAPADTQLRLSVDGGFTFSSPQQLDVLPHEHPIFYDNALPLVTLADDDRVHLFWHYFEGDHYSVNYTHGDRIAPCGLKSGV